MFVLKKKKILWEYVRGYFWVLLIARARDERLWGALALSKTRIQEHVCKLLSGVAFGLLYIFWRHIFSPFSHRLSSFNFNSVLFYIYRCYLNTGRKISWNLCLEIFFLKSYDFQKKNPMKFIVIKLLLHVLIQFQLISY